MDAADANLMVLWTTGDLDTALNMVLMYAHNAKLQNWWDEVNLLIWGASQQLATREPKVQAKIEAMIADGVNVIACRKCAENLGVVEALKQLKVKVFYTGEYLTDWLRSGQKMITI